jgi:hypothetical protein
VANPRAAVGRPGVGRPKGVSLCPLDGPLTTIHLASPWSWNSPIDDDKETFKVFVKGIYSSFGDEEPRTIATTKIFELCRKFQLPSKQTQNLFSAKNLWPSLEFALKEPTTESVLLQKCESMLESNKAVYRDGENIKLLKGSTVAHVFKLRKLPLTKEEVKDVMIPWIQHNNENCADLHLVLVAMMDLFVDEGAWKVPILNVVSDDVLPFSIKFQPKASVNVIFDQIQFVVQKPIDCISIEHDNWQTATGGPLGGCHD